MAYSIDIRLNKFMEVIKMNLENLTIEELEELKEQIKEEMIFREEEHERFIEEYENNPMVCEGWAQQDLIDIRRER